MRRAQLQRAPRLTRERVDVAGRVAHDEQVVVVAGGEALAAQAQRGRAHALQLGVGAQRRADEGILGGRRE